MICGGGWSGMCCGRYVVVAECKAEGVLGVQGLR